MSNLWLPPVSRVQDVGTNLAGNAQGSQTVYGTVLTGGAANAIGAWQQLVAATDYDASGFILTTGMGGAVTNNQFMISLSTGTAGNEASAILVPNVYYSPMYGAAGYCQDGIAVPFPIAIPAGTRLSAAVQAQSTSGQANVNLQLLQGRPSGNPGSYCLQYSASNATTKGSTVTPNATANTKGSWVEMITSAPYDIKRLYLFPAGTTSAGAYMYAIDVGVGTAGSEQVVVPNLLCTTESGVKNTSPAFFFVDIGIPAGSRVALRCQCTAASGQPLLISMNALY